MNTHAAISALILFTNIFAFSFNVDAQDAKWIYYPGEYEIYQHSKIHQQRTERNQSYPAMWRIDTPYNIVDFQKKVSLKKPEKASLTVDGDYFLILNNGIESNFNPNNFILPAGEYTITIRVSNIKTVPAILFDGESVNSDESWTAIVDGELASASTYSSGDAKCPPSTFNLATESVRPQSAEKKEDYDIYDFGKNTFGYPVLEGIKGKGKINIYYGESREEAMAEKIAETWDEKHYELANNGNDTLPTKAFRYVKIVKEPSITYEDFSMIYEYLPVNYRGSFDCSDTLLNKIYKTALYTFHLTTRECHLDGIKRDRWAWSGDALQSYWMNFYTFFDEDVNKRTLWGLRGHMPINRHMNTIPDYTFYWLIGINSHFQYTGDSTFVKQIYPRMKETLRFTQSRLTSDGLILKRPGDWIFVDWAPINKEGILSFEQFLYIKSLEAVSECAQIAGDEEEAMATKEAYRKAIIQFDSLFWADTKGAFIHKIPEKGEEETITRYTNMFALLFNAVDEQRREKIKNNVILNSDILQITTPYMKFYELAALCEAGEQRRVLDFVRSYWGGMLRLGATTFWEEYNPSLPDDKQYEMYGRPFAKSLCHAWGANPLYLFGRYYLGVRPLKAGYDEYLIEPELGGLRWINGTVPTPNGDITVNMNDKNVRIKTANIGIGKLIVKSKRVPKCSNAKVQKVSESKYEIVLGEPNTIYNISYMPL